MTTCRARSGSVNSKFVKRQDCELVVECYHELHLKSLQYEKHRYQPYNICEPLSNPAIGTTGKEPTRGPRVHYCYSSALQMAVNMWKLYTSSIVWS